MISPYPYTHLALKSWFVWEVGVWAAAQVNLDLTVQPRIASLLLRLGLERYETPQLADFPLLYF